MLRQLRCGIRDRNKLQTPKHPNSRESPNARIQEIGANPGDRPVRLCSALLAFARLSGRKTAGSRSCRAKMEVQGYANTEEPLYKRIEQGLQGYTSLYKGIQGYTRLFGKNRIRKVQGRTSNENSQSVVCSGGRALRDGTAANTRACPQHSCPVADNWYNGSNAPKSVN
jgi:hypothetical protein